MYKYFLNSTEVEEPDGVDGLLFIQARHSKYFGFWGGVGLNEGDANASLVFTEPKAMAILKKHYERDFIKTELVFKIIDCNSSSTCNNIAYSVDFSEYLDNGIEISCTFRSSGGNEVRSRVEVKYAISPKTYITIPTKELEGQTTNEIMDTIGLVTGTNNEVTHNVPLTGIANVFVLTESIYQNVSSAKLIDVIGVLEWYANSSVSASYQVGVFVLDAQNNVIQILDNALSYTTQTVSNNVLETKSFSVIGYALQPYHKIVIRAYNAVVLPDFEFNWQNSESNSNGIIVRDHKTTDLYSTNKGLLVRDAFSEVIKKMSDSKMTLKSDWLDNCNDIWITNGFNLKEIERPLNISLDDLFEGLNPVFNIEISIDGNFVRVELKNRKKAIHHFVKGDFDVQISTNNEFLFSHVKAGYKEWKSDTIFGNDEINSEREYQTEYIYDKQTCNIVSTFIASHYLIEKVKRQKGEEKADTKWDDLIFVVAVGMDSSGFYQAETADTFQLVAGVIYPNNTLNFRISPARNLYRHRSYLHISGDTTFKSGTGNFTALHNQGGSCIDAGMNIIENMDFVGLPVGTLFGKSIATITKNGTIDEFCKIKEQISFDYCSKTYEGVLRNKKIKTGITPEITLEIYI